jgi:hypothetical protein
MGHIKKFHEFQRSGASEINEENDMDLLRDLEDIGMNEKTYTKEMLKDAMDGVDFADYLKLEAGDEFEFNMDSSYSDTTIKAYFMGGISGTWDTSSLWNEIESRISDINIRDYEEDGEERYEMDEVEAAFDSVNWDRQASSAEDNALDDVEVEVDASTRDNEVEIEAEASIDNDYVSDYIDQDDIIQDILDNL